ncbi:MAG: YncE family protein, partial [Candidatus Angelobacter sp.]
MNLVKIGTFAILSLALCFLLAHSSILSRNTRSTSFTVERGHALKQVDTIDLPGPKGKRFDYLTIDYDDGYLLSAHLGAGLLYVIDLKSNQLLKAIPDVPGVEGVEYVPELKKAYTSDWYENKVGVIDLQQMKVIAKVPTEDKPDGSAYA